MKCRCFVYVLRREYSKMMKSPVNSAISYFESYKKRFSMNIC